MTFPIEHPELQYQDGTQLVPDEVLLDHMTREGHLESLLLRGVAPSIRSHECEGLWLFALRNYTRGQSRMERTGGIAVTVAVPRCLGENLLHNNKIRGDGQLGHLRFVGKG